MTSPRFIGIDLAWQSNAHPSGAAVLCGDREGAELLAVTGSLHSLRSVTDFIVGHESYETVVAIDAPLIIENDSGQRHCETLVSRAYGSRHASCHTSNRSRFPDAASVRLAGTLMSRGYRHATTIVSRRTLMEVYPHPALIELFALPSILKYKKGSVSARAQGLEQLQRLLATLELAEPRLLTSPPLSTLLATPPTSLRGSARKALEDSLDALVCAYIAYHYWYWDGKRTAILGDSSEGYIAIPTTSAESMARASV